MPNMTGRIRYWKCGQRSEFNAASIAIARPAIQVAILAHTPTHRLHRRVTDFLMDLDGVECVRLAEGKLSAWMLRVQGRRQKDLPVLREVLEYCVPHVQLVTSPDEGLYETIRWLSLQTHGRLNTLSLCERCGRRIPFAYTRLLLRDDRGTEVRKVFCDSCSMRLNAQSDRDFLLSLVFSDQALFKQLQHKSVQGKPMRFGISLKLANPAPQAAAISL